MMLEDKTPRTGTPVWVRKLLIPAALGGVIGFAAASATMRFVDSETVDGLGASALVAVMVALFYTVTGVAVGLGAASPRLGARFLNVEDADEVREQKRVLIYSGVAMALWGIGLFALALAAPVGPVPQAMALALGVGGLLVGGVLSVVAYRACDELMRMAHLEAAAITYGLVVLVVGLWSMFAHVGQVAAPAPLDLLTLFYVLVLAASFVAVGRRGMLVIR